MANYETELTILEGMGFDRQQSLYALEKTKGDVPGAIDVLIPQTTQVNNGSSSSVLQPVYALPSSTSSSCFSGFSSSSSASMITADATCADETSGVSTGGFSHADLSMGLNNNNIHALTHAAHATQSSNNLPPLINFESGRENFSHLDMIDLTIPCEYNPYIYERKSAMPVGLQNIGNTCYMNSFLQSLFSMYEVVDVLLRFRTKKEIREHKRKRKQKQKQNKNVLQGKLSEESSSGGEATNSEEEENSTANKEEDDEEDGRVAKAIRLVLELRRLFGLMLFSNRTSVRPEGLMAQIFFNFSDRKGNVKKKKKKKNTKNVNNDTNEEKEKKKNNNSNCNNPDAYEESDNYEEENAQQNRTNFEQQDVAEFAYLFFDLLELGLKGGFLIKRRTFRREKANKRNKKMKNENESKGSKNSKTNARTSSKNKRINSTAVFNNNNDNDNAHNNNNILNDSMDQPNERVTDSTNQHILQKNEKEIKRVGEANNVSCREKEKTQTCSETDRQEAETDNSNYYEDDSYGEDDEEDDDEEYEPGVNAVELIKRAFFGECVELLKFPTGEKTNKMRESENKKKTKKKHEYAPSQAIHSDAFLSAARRNCGSSPAVSASCFSSISLSSSASSSAPSSSFCPSYSSSSPLSSPCSSSSSSFVSFSSSSCLASSFPSSSSGCFSSFLSSSSSTPSCTGRGDDACAYVPSCSSLDGPKSSENCVCAENHTSNEASSLPALTNEQGLSGAGVTAPLLFSSSSFSPFSSSSTCSCSSSCSSSSSVSRLPCPPSVPSSCSSSAVSSSSSSGSLFQSCASSSSSSSSLLCASSSYSSSSSSSPSSAIALSSTYENVEAPIPFSSQSSSSCNVSLSSSSSSASQSSSFSFAFPSSISSSSSVSSSSSSTVFSSSSGCSCVSPASSSGCSSNRENEEEKTRSTKNAGEKEEKSKNKNLSKKKKKEKIRSTLFQQIILNVQHKELYDAFDAHCYNEVDYIVEENQPGEPRGPIRCHTEWWLKRKPVLLFFHLNRVVFNRFHSESCKLQDDFRFPPVFYVDRYLYTKRKKIRKIRKNATLVKNTILQVDNALNRFKEVATKKENLGEIFSFIKTLIENNLYTSKYFLHFLCKKPVNNNDRKCSAFNQSKLTEKNAKVKDVLNAIHASLYSVDKLPTNSNDMALKNNSINCNNNNIINNVDSHMEEDTYFEEVCCKNDIRMSSIMPFVIENKNVNYRRVIKNLAAKDYCKNTKCTYARQFLTKISNIPDESVAMVAYSLLPDPSWLVVQNYIGDATDMHFFVKFRKGLSGQNNIENEHEKNCSSKKEEKDENICNTGSNSEEGNTQDKVRLCTKYGGNDNNNNNNNNNSWAGENANVYNTNTNRKSTSEDTDPEGMKDAHNKENIHAASNCASSHMDNTGVLDDEEKRLRGLDPFKFLQSLETSHILDFLHSFQVLAERQTDALECHLADLRRDFEHLFDEFDKHPFGLHAIWIHQGTATGGHYWVYIRDIATNLWHKYDDRNVQVVSLYEVMEKARGSKKRELLGKTDGTPSSAYVLLYIPPKYINVVLHNLSITIDDIKNEDNNFFSSSYSTSFSFTSNPFSFSSRSFPSFFNFCPPGCSSTTSVHPSDSSSPSFSPSSVSSVSAASAAALSFPSPDGHNEVLTDEEANLIDCNSNSNADTNNNFDESNFSPTSLLPYLSHAFSSVIVNKSACATHNNTNVDSSENKQANSGGVDDALLCNSCSSLPSSSAMLSTACSAFNFSPPSLSSPSSSCSLQLSESVNTSSDGSLSSSACVVSSASSNSSSSLCYSSCSASSFQSISSCSSSVVACSSPSATLCVSSSFASSCALSSSSSSSCSYSSCSLPSVLHSSSVSCICSSASEVALASSSNETSHNDAFWIDQTQNEVGNEQQRSQKKRRSGKSASKSENRKTKNSKGCKEEEADIQQQIGDRPDLIWGVLLSYFKMQMPSSLWKLILRNNLEFENEKEIWQRSYAQLIANKIVVIYDLHVERTIKVLEELIGENWQKYEKWIDRIQNKRGDMGDPRFLSLHIFFIFEVLSLCDQTPAHILTPHKRTELCFKILGRDWLDVSIKKVCKEFEEKYNVKLKKNVFEEIKSDYLNPIVAKHLFKWDVFDPTNNEGVIESFAFPDDYFKKKKKKKCSLFSNENEQRACLEVFADFNQKKSFSRFYYGYKILKDAVVSIKKGSLLYAIKLVYVHLDAQETFMLTDHLNFLKGLFAYCFSCGFSQEITVKRMSSTLNDLSVFYQVLSLLGLALVLKDRDFAYFYSVASYVVRFNFPDVLLPGGNCILWGALNKALHGILWQSAQQEEEILSVAHRTKCTLGAFFPDFFRRSQQMAEEYPFMCDGETVPLSYDDFFGNEVFQTHFDLMRAFPTNMTNNNSDCAVRDWVENSLLFSTTLISLKEASVEYANVNERIGVAEEDGLSEGSCMPNLEVIVDSDIKEMESQYGANDDENDQEDITYDQSEQEEEEEERKENGQSHVCDVCETQVCNVSSTGQRQSEIVEEQMPANAQNEPQQETDEKNVKDKITGEVTESDCVLRSKKLQGANEENIKCDKNAGVSGHENADENNTSKSSYGNNDSNTTKNSSGVPLEGEDCSVNITEQPSGTIHITQANEKIEVDATNCIQKEEKTAENDTIRITDASYEDDIILCPTSYSQFPSCGTPGIVQECKDRGHVQPEKSPAEQVEEAMAPPVLPEGNKEQERTEEETMLNNRRGREIAVSLIDENKNAHFPDKLVIGRDAAEHSSAAQEIDKENQNQQSNL